MQQRATRQRILVVLDGDIAQLDAEMRQRLLDEVREKTGDEKSSVISIVPGSILLELDVSAEAAAMLKKLFENGDLKSIGGIPILAIKDHPRKLLGSVSGTMPESAEAALADFFVSAFAADEIRRFVRGFSDGARLDAALPGALTSLGHLASEVVRVFVRHDLVSPVLFEKLEEERPRRREEIRRMRQLFEGVAGAALNQPSP